MVGILVLVSFLTFFLGDNDDNGKDLVMLFNITTSFATPHPQKSFNLEKSRITIHVSSNWHLKKKVILATLECTKYYHRRKLQLGGTQISCKHQTDLALMAVIFCSLSLDLDRRPGEGQAGLCLVSIINYSCYHCHATR